ncbi:MAG: universal stress protein [Paracoccaceae bacterium]|nr:universal stress protein [Paracoccaceae bacterium]
MYQHVLLAVAPDETVPLAKGLEVARCLAAPGGRITALTVIEEVPGYVAVELPEGLIASSHERTIARFRERLSGADDVEPVVTSGHAGAEIVAWSERHGVDCIVVMSHRPGPSDLILGSTAARVVRHAKTAVHVLR